MSNQSQFSLSRRGYTCALLLAILAWLAVILQFYLIILNRTVSIPETVIRFFSYFTILINISVALCLTSLLIKSKSGFINFLSKPKTVTAIAVYISIVGIIYNTILRFLWEVQGLQFVVDEMLHAIVPVFFVLFWIFFVPKKDLIWRDIYPWLLLPLIYIIFILVRGPSSGFYPYPFIDVDKLGYSKVFLNCVFVFLAFVLVSLLFIAVGKLILRQARFK